MPLVLSCPYCLNLFPAAGAGPEVPLACPSCRDAFIPAEDAHADKTVWYVLHGQHKYGPFILARLQQLVALGWVSATDRITRLGAAHWLPAGAIEHLFPGGGKSRPAAPAEAEVAVTEVPGPLTAEGVLVRPHHSVTIGDFQILKKLGAGTMGAVYLAHQRSRDRLVALKMLAKHLAVQEAFVARFHREAGLLARLRHPGLITYYGVGEEKDIPYFAMEFVEGISAARALKHFGGRFQVADAIHVVLRCAEALGYAHGLRVVHRDVKPENVMITRLGRVKVTDLGLAKPLDEDLSLTESGVGVGTPHYMAPEQARNAKHADQRSDIYALGGVLYHFLTGRPPWQGESVMDLQHDKEHGIFPAARRLNGDVPPALDLVLNRMLARNPARRYPDCGEVVRDLQALGLDGDYLGFNPLRVINAAAPLGRHDRIEVLLIHGRPDDIALAQQALEGSGVPSNLSAVSGGREACAFLRRQGRYAGAPRPALVVLGRELDGATAREVLAELQPEPGVAPIPVVVLGNNPRSLAALEGSGVTAGPGSDPGFGRLIDSVQNIAPPTIVQGPGA